jgi:hypothetical protein
MVWRMAVTSEAGIIITEDIFGLVLACGVDSQVLGARAADFWIRWPDGFNFYFRLKIIEDGPKMTLR